MKLLIRDTRIIGTATEGYSGPEKFIAAPNGFDPLADLDRYEYRDGELCATQATSVTALQARLALDAAGMADAFDNWATSPLRTFAERSFIGFAQEWRRDDPTLAAAAADLGLTAEQVDELFGLAGTL